MDNKVLLIELNFGHQEVLFPVDRVNGSPLAVEQFFGMEPVHLSVMLAKPGGLPCNGIAVPVYKTAALVCLSPTDDPQNSFGGVGSLI